MHREYHRWFSGSLQREMELLFFGHDGPPMLVFPTSMGAFYEFEDRGMIGALGGKLAHGQLRLACISSVDGESWYNRRAHPRHRVLRHLQYEDYILNDVVPLIRHLTWRDTIGVTGCSFGAYHAMAFALRHPYTFTWCVTMGGAFEVRRFLDGYFDEDCYFLDPTSFLPGLGDPYYLDQLRRNKFVLATGDHDICRGANEHFAGLLSAKGIPHSLHVWNHSKHDWPDWRPMASAYLP
ncbi:MAG TPA: alpha/beta hydrolase-fold protein [Vicinamibacterales bacterium]|jgi:esterase/lipase superfamily enzyme|nr:alpha/beta hydrolase-fold protein [Vicinamibacterales bacterium]